MGTIGFTWSYTAISFLLSGTISVIVDIYSYRLWKKQPNNEVTYNFFMAMAFFALYFLYRGVASVLFAYHPAVLAAVYASSHIALGFFAAFLVNMGVAGIWPNYTFIAFVSTLGLMAVDIFYNIIYPNTPHFTAAHHIIEWGTNPLVGKMHTLMIGLPLLLVLGIFIYQALKSWADRTLRVKTSVMIFSIIVGFFGLVLRDVFPSVMSIFISDLSYVFLMVVVAVFVV